MQLLLALAVCASTVAATAWSPAEESVNEPEVGHLGLQPPEVTDVRVSDALIHQDTTGGVMQQLLGITGSRGAGYGLVWRDQRDGTLGISCARLDGDGVLREPERSVTAHLGTSRRFDPAVAIAADGSGTVAWVQRHSSGQRPWLRSFKPDGAWYGSDLIVEGGDAPAPRGGAGREGGAAGARSPVAVARRDGSRTLVWVEGARLRAADFDVSGMPVRPPADFGPAGTEPEAGFLAVEDADGGLAALWTGKNGVGFARRAGDGGKTHDVQLGAGRARGLVPAAGGGFWALVQRDDEAVLRRVGPDAKPVGAEIARALPGLRELELASFPGGLALLATRGEGAAPASDGGRPKRSQSLRPGAESSVEPQRPGARGEAPRGGAPGVDARFELLLADSNGAFTDPEPLVVVSDAGRGVADAHIASDGARLLVAWTDSRLGDADVWCRVVDPTQAGPARLGPEKRVNSDVASSDQINPDVAAIGDRGWTVWQDRRNGPGTIYARAFDAKGPSGDEIALPVRFGDAPAATSAANAQEPAIAIRGDGAMLVTWTERTGDRGVLCGQVLGADGAAKSARIEIEARDSSVHGKAMVETLAGDRGWLVVWSGGGKLGIQARRVATDGALAGPARRIQDDGDDETSQVDVARLDDGRLFAAWTAHAANAGRDAGWSIRGRFLDADGAPKGSEIKFEASRRNEDHDPALAPAQDGGFLMAWCSGLPSDPTHDVNVRMFDAQGRPAGPNLTPCYLANEQDFADVARLGDGSFAVVWEDDISYNDQTYVRRVGANGKSMGPLMRINRLETTLVPDRVTPRITAFGDGWAAVFADRQRSQGFDARIKIVGPRFDAPSGG